MNWIDKTPTKIGPPRKKEADKTVNICITVSKKSFAALGNDMKKTGRKRSKIVNEIIESYYSRGAK